MIKPNPKCIECVGTGMVGRLLPHCTPMFQMIMCSCVSKQYDKMIRDINKKRRNKK